MKILILFGHPAFQNSIVNKQLVAATTGISNITFHDLYEAYPEMDIDIDFEQKLLEEHDCLIFQHPMYWYSAPAIFKEWQDLVLEHGWAYGSKGKALHGKLFFNVVTTGAPYKAFLPGQFQNHTVRDFLVPYYQMASLCGLISLPPFVIHGTHVISEEKLKRAHNQYSTILNMLSNDELDPKTVQNFEYLNHIVKEED